MPGIDPAFDGQGCDIGGVLGVVMGVDDFCGFQSMRLWQPGGEEIFIGVKDCILAFAVGVEFNRAFFCFITGHIYFLLIFLPYSSRR